MPAGANADGGGAEHGLYGGLAVQPAGARWFDPVTGAELVVAGAGEPVPRCRRAERRALHRCRLALADGRRSRETVQLSQDVIPVVPPAPVGGVVFEAPERFSFNYGSEAEYKRIEYKPEGAPTASARRPACRRGRTVIRRR